MMMMNDKALYQLERAIDALSQMAKYLREDQNDNISFVGSGVLGGSNDVGHSDYWYDYDRNDYNRPNPFFGTTVSSSSSPDVITFS
jgi:hypothetical protein